MNKTYTFLSAILADKPLTVTNGSASISEAQLDAIEAALADKDRLCNERQAAIETKDKAIEDRDKTIADLQAKLSKQPADNSKQVVDSGSKGDSAPKNEAEQYCETVNSARKLYNLV